MADDRALIEAARGGDRVALDTLLRNQYDRIYALCRRLTGNEADALDAAQEALIAVARGLPRFDGRSSFGTWCYRVATNACLDELRRRRRRPEPFDPASAIEWRSGRGGNSSDPASVIADRTSVDKALAELSPEFRAAVVLRDLCDLDYAEISEVLGIPPGTVRSRIARARAALAAGPLGNRDDDRGRPTPRP